MKSITLCCLLDDTLLFMALFRQHISFGALVAMIGVVLAYYYAYVTDWRLLTVLFLVTVFASFLPDLDSDSGLPFHFIFGTFTLIVGGITLWYTLESGTDNMYELTGKPLLVLILVWFVGGGLFKRLTHHRGMMHSLPAAGIAALLMFIIARALSEVDMTTLLLALGAGAGYLSHLILDELHSTVSMGGHLFQPRRSLGTALKLFSPSRSATIFTYVLLVVLAYIALT